MVFLQISQISQDNTCVGVSMESFLKKLQASSLRACNFIEKKIPTVAFLWNL